MSMVRPTLIAPDESGFASNNPFRRRASQSTPFSPDSLSPTNPGPLASSKPPRPQSRNPFLDVFDDKDDDYDISNNRPRSATHKYSFDSSIDQKPQFTGNTLDLFNELALDDQNSNTYQDKDRMKPPPPRPQQQGLNNLRPPQPLPRRGSRTEDTKDQGPFSAGPTTRRAPPPPTARRGPPEAARPRPRRNSDSSILDHEMDREWERRERRKREEARRARGSASNGKSGSVSNESSSKSRRKGTPLDVIDKLDVTGMYGSGLFHHDGPFDACNPHRNKNSRKAPMQAFAADSANNSLGFGPVPKKLNHDDYFGNRDPEAYSEWSSGKNDDGSYRPATTRAHSFDPKSKTEAVHGDETLGLGTSTFLEGAPASRKAIEEQMQQARLSDDGDRPKTSGNMGGIARKKSLAQKIRSISTTRNIENREPRRTPTSNLSTPNEDRISPGMRRKDNNPFFNDYDSAYDRKGEAIESISVVKTRDRAPSSPKKPLGFRGDGDDGGSSGGGSLLKRVRSLSKPKRRDQVQ